MAGFASPISGPVLRTVAETAVCSAAESFDVYHLECVPDMGVAPGIPVGGQRTHADRVQRQRLHPFTGGYRSSNIG